MGFLRVDIPPLRYSSPLTPLGKPPGDATVNSESEAHRPEEWLPVDIIIRIRTNNLFTGFPITTSLRIRHS